MQRIMTLVLAAALACIIQPGTVLAEDPDMSFDQQPPAKGSQDKDSPRREHRQAPRMNQLRDVPNEGDDIPGYQSTVGGNLAPGRGDLEGDARTIPAFFEELFPERAKHLREMQGKDPGTFRRMVWHVRRLSRELMQIKRTDMEEFEQRVKIVGLEGEMEMQAMKLKVTSDEKERTAIEKDLRKTVGALFDAKESVQRRHIKRMEKDMADLKAKLEKRRKSREKIIDKKVEELKQEHDEMEF